MVLLRGRRAGFSRISRLVSCTDLILTILRILRIAIRCHTLVDQVLL